MPDNNTELIDVFFNFTKNALQHDFAREQIRQSLSDKLQKQVPDILSRMEDMHPFVTTELGEYVDIIGEARTSYELGLYVAAVTLAGVAAERFSSELYSRIKIQRGQDEMAVSQVFGDTPSQYRRIEILYAFGVISQSIRAKLQRIREIRNSYVHPKGNHRSSEDALETLNVFFEILQERFEEKYTFRDGMIVPKLS